MNLQIIQGILIPFLGTVIGSSFVFFMKKEMSLALKKALSGFAAGVMVAASVWSLLIPAMEDCADMGIWSFVPAAAGFWIGILFLLLIDSTVPHLHVDALKPEGYKSHLKKTTMLMLAVTIHNIPEGMSVGVVYAGWMAGDQALTMAGALGLAVGIALQNIPEGAIISMPLRAQGLSKMKAFVYGSLSGIVEPLGSLLILLAARLFVPYLPYLLGFAAGAMMYVVVEELLPEMSEGEHSNLGTVVFALGFTLMMALDVVFG